MTWTHGDNILAMREGWAIFDASGEDQLQRIDEGAAFASDEGAWLHVWWRAAQASELHSRALNHLRIHSPIEFDRIFDYCAVHGAKEPA